MGIIIDTLIKAITDGLEKKEIPFKVNRPKDDKVNVGSNNTPQKVFARIEPDVDLMPGWVISVLEGDIQIETKNDPEDSRFEEKTFTIPMADPKSIVKTLDAVENIPLINSSSHAGIILMEVPDDDIENEEKWKFTILKGMTVKTDDDGKQEIVPSDIFKPGVMINPDKETKEAAK